MFTCVKRIRPLEAVRFTGRNQREIDSFIGDHGHTAITLSSDKEKQLAVTFIWGYVRTLNVGDYLVRDAEEMYDRINSDVFERNYIMIDAWKFHNSVKTVKEAYDKDDDFRQATIASILSAMKELNGSHSDEDVAVAIADRLFGDS